MSSDMCLTTVRDLCDALDEGGVAYCHWKSNDRLQDATAGLTDLDLLIDDAHAEEARARLAQLGFVPAVAVWYRRYPGIEDHLAVDPETGRLVHVHLHLRLVVGTRLTKPYRLPWEKEILSRRERDPLAGLYRTDAASEMLLLLVRLVLKGTHRPSTRGDATVDQAALREHRHLRAHVDAAACAQLTATLLGPAAVEPARRLCQGDLDTGTLSEFATACAATLRCFRRMPLPREYAARLGRRAGRLLHRASQRTPLLLPQRRTLQGPGVIVCVVGADGSGKSTLTRHLRTTLGAKFDVLGLYLGSGDGPGSLIRAPLDALKRAARGRPQVPTSDPAIEARPNEPTARRSGSRRGGPLRRLFGLLWSLALAWEKRRKLGRAVLAKTRGFVVITDRYPQTHVLGFNDGPRLSHLGATRNPLLRALARWEHDAYRVDARRAPDLVIKLIGDPHVLAGRRPEMRLATIVAKQQAILELPDYPGARSLTIDAGYGEERVRTTALRHVGALLKGRP